LPARSCFIEYPEESLLSIWEAVETCIDKKVKSVMVDHHRVRSYNLTSEALLGVGAEVAEQWRRLTKSPIKISGSLPESPDHQQLINEIGIIKELNAKSSRPVPLPTEKQHLFSYKSVKKSTPSAHSVDDKTIASEKLTEHVNDCIRDHKLELTNEASELLMKSVSEVLDNAERHSVREGKGGHVWYARGYLNSHSKSQNFEVSIFNFGITIADSFLMLPEGSYSRNLVLDYANAHEGEFTIEQLITVAALQQLYSCKNEDDSENNGQGTVFLIQFFERMCEEFSQKFGRADVKPMMSIVSGKTHIIFDGTYRLSQLSNYNNPDAEEGDEQLIISFNEQNSLRSPPDPRYVRKLSRSFFPGVAISIRFPLKEEDDE